MSLTDAIPDSDSDSDSTPMLPIYTQRAKLPSTPTAAYFSDRVATEAAKAKLEARVADLEA